MAWMNARPSALAAPLATVYPRANPLSRHPLCESSVQARRSRVDRSLRYGCYKRVSRKKARGLEMAVLPRQTSYKRNLDPSVTCLHDPDRGNDLLMDTVREVLAYHDCTESCTPSPST